SGETTPEMGRKTARTVPESFHLIATTCEDAGGAAFHFLRTLSRNVIAASSLASFLLGRMLASCSYYAAPMLAYCLTPLAYSRTAGVVRCWYIACSTQGTCKSL